MRPQKASKWFQWRTVLQHNKRCISFLPKTRHLYSQFPCASGPMITKEHLGSIHKTLTSRNVKVSSGTLTKCSYQVLWNVCACTQVHKIILLSVWNFSSCSKLVSSSCSKFQTWQYCSWERNKFMKGNEGLHVTLDSTSYKRSWLLWKLEMHSNLHIWSPWQSMENH